MHVVASIVVADPFTLDLLTTEDADILVRGSNRLFGGSFIRQVSDSLALPSNDFQCVHVEIDYVQKDDAAKGVTTAVYNRCMNSINEDGSYLCPYHDRVLLSIKLSPADLAQINATLNARYQDDVVEGVIKTDKRELKRFPIKRVNGLRIHVSPHTPALKDKHGHDREIAVSPEWEKVTL